MGLWSELVTTFLPFLKRKPGKSAAGGGGGPDLKELKQALVVKVERQGQRKVMQFEITEMALNAFVFRSRTAVVKGEMLSTEFNLPQLGPTKLTGTVDWVLESGGSHTGQINIWTSPEQRSALHQLIRSLRRY